MLDGAYLASAFDFSPKLRLVAGGGIAVALPPVESADQFAHLKAQRQQFQRRFRRGVAADAIAVADIEL